MASNRGVVYLGPGKVEVQSIDYPKLQNPKGKKIDHGVILKIVTTNICGSDQHMVRGRTTAPSGLVLGHEITGEVIEKGSDVEFLNVGDLVTVPFNIACGRCRNCREGKTGVCLTVNPARPGARVRLRRHGRMGGRPGRIRSGSLCRFQPDQVPRQSEGDVEDQGPDHALRYFPDRLSRRVYGRRGDGLGGLRRGRGAGGIGVRGVLPLAGRGCRDRRRHDSRAPGAGQEFRLRDNRPAKKERRWRIRSSRSWAYRKWTRRWIASASKRADTAATRESNGRPRC